MTIKEAIETTDTLKPNVFHNREKMKWLSELDGKIKKEIFDTHEGSPSFDGYDEDTDSATPLLVPEPYSDVYIKYLMAQIDFHLAEIARYNNDMILFNTAYDDLARWYHRTHRPLQTKLIYTI